MKTVISANEPSWKDREPATSYIGLRQRRSASFGYHKVMVDFAKSDDDSLTLNLVLASAGGEIKCEMLEADSQLRLSAVLKHCIFDLDGFPGNGSSMVSILQEALNYALNALGSLEFSVVKGTVVAKFTFHDHYIFFIFEKEDALFFFERA